MSYSSQSLEALVPKEESTSNKGSSFVGFLNFFKVLFGAGILGLPSAFNLVGLWLSILGYGIIASVVWYTMMILLDAYAAASKRSTKKIITYADLTEYAFGTKGKIVVETLVIVLELSFCTGFLIVITSQVTSLLRISEGIILLCIFPILVLLCSIRWIKDMWIISIFGLIVYLIGIISSTFYQSIVHMNTPDAWSIVEWHNFPKFYGQSIYALDGINLVLPIAFSLKQQNDRKLVISAGLGGYAILTISYAGVGYMAGLGSCSDATYVTDCMPDGLIRNIIRWALSISLLLNYPLTIYPAFEMIEERFIISNNTNKNEIQRKILRIFQIIVTCLVAYLIPQFDVFSEFIGGLFLTCVGFIVPPMLYVKIVGGSIITKIILILIIILGIFNMIIGTYFSVKDIIALI